MAIVIVAWALQVQRAARMAEVVRESQALRVDLLPEARPANALHVMAPAAATLQRAAADAGQAGWTFGA